MKHYKILSNKLYIVIALLTLILFLSNDFALIAVQKTAIITAVGIDKGVGGNINATAQIAVPEATNTTASNNKAVVTGSGKTISAAIQNIGEITGWFPKLSFCNLIIVGENYLDTNIIEILDYFSKTLKVQDSAVVTACFGSAKELLSSATPLDNISSFALQKILLKNTGMSSDVAQLSIKNFSIGYYSRSASSYMPQVKMSDAESGDTSGGGETSGSGGNNVLGGESQSGGEKEKKDKNAKKVFDASTTLLFKKGVLKEKLTSKETQVFNLLIKPANESAIAVEDVEYKGEKAHFLLSVIHNKHKIELKFSGGKPLLEITEKIFAKIEDQTSEDIELNLKSNVFIPKEATDKAEKDFEKLVLSVLEKCKNSGVDLLRLDNKLFKYHQKKYASFRDIIYEQATIKLNIKFRGLE